MKNSDSHIYLYAKHHYKRGDIVEDLQKILSKRSALPVECITKEDIILVLSSIVYPEINSKYRFRDLLNDILPKNAWIVGGSSKIEENKDIELNIIRKFLSIIAHTTIIGENGKRLIELDEPDSNILPLNKINF